MIPFLRLFIPCCSCLVAESCLTLLRPYELYSPPGSSGHGISKARILEWVAISFSIKHTYYIQIIRMCVNYKQGLRVENTNIFLYAFLYFPSFLLQNFNTWGKKIPCKSAEFIGELSSFPRTRLVSGFAVGILPMFVE